MNVFRSIKWSVAMIALNFRRAVISFIIFAFPFCLFILLVFTLSYFPHPPAKHSQFVNVLKEGFQMAQHPDYVILHLNNVHSYYVLSSYTVFYVSEIQYLCHWVANQQNTRLSLIADPISSLVSHF
jgi:hypothetical protein